MDKQTMGQIVQRMDAVSAEAGAMALWLDSQPGVQKWLARDLRSIRSRADAIGGYMRQELAKIALADEESRRRAERDAKEREEALASGADAQTYLPGWAREGA